MLRDLGALRQNRPPLTLPIYTADGSRSTPARATSCGTPRIVVNSVRASAPDLRGAESSRTCCFSPDMFNTTTSVSSR